MKIARKKKIWKKYTLIPDNRYSSIMLMVKKINCRVCWVGMLKNFEDFEEIELDELYGYLEEKMIFVVQVKKSNMKNIIYIIIIY